MPLLSKLEALPRDILEEIALFIVGSQFLGPPTALAPLLRISPTISKTLDKNNNPHFYARIFRRKFDVRAPSRRLGDGIHARALTDELVRRSEGLKRLRQNEYPRGVHGDALDGRLKADLWIAYLMFIENDGKNAPQLLLYAQIDNLALEFVRPGGRLHDGADGNEGWTIDNEVNALGMWLFWFTDDERVRGETSTDREEILGALGCLFVGSFKYAPTYAPLTSFLIPPTTPPPQPSPHSTLPLSALPVHPPCVVSGHFGRRLTLARPLLTPPALLASLVRLRGCGGGVPRGSVPPATRAEAIRMGWSGAMGERLAAFERQGTSGVEWTEEGSGRHEHDWARLLTCYNPWSRPPMRKRVFAPGMLDGVWEGRWLTIPPDFFQSLLQTVQAHTPVLTSIQPPVFQQPMQFRLLEHHQHDRNDVVEFDDMSSDGVGRGALRAWLPEGTEVVEKHGQLQVSNPNNKEPSTYRTYDPEQAALDEELPRDAGQYGGGVLDIILTAETEDDFSEVWGNYRYVGRVRNWDGLVVLVREMRPNAGRWVFRGYVHGNQNLVGRWRETGTEVSLPGWEGVWGMVKRPE